MEIQTWIDEKLAEIAEKLPTLVHEDPASITWGYNLRYKSALLELDRILEEL